MRCECCGITTCNLWEVYAVYTALGQLIPKKNYYCVPFAVVVQGGVVAGLGVLPPSSAIFPGCQPLCQVWCRRSCHHCQQQVQQVQLSLRLYLYQHSLRIRQASQSVPISEKGCFLSRTSWSRRLCDWSISK